MTDRIYEFYVLDPTGSRHKIFRGTVEDFQKVEELYGELWGKVIDSQLGLLGDEHAGVLTDDPILQNWEGVDITAVDFTTKVEFWYIGNAELEPKPFGGYKGQGGGEL